ncbi:MAG: YdcF family protein [Polyangiaceae bacterium]
MLRSRPSGRIRPRRRRPRHDAVRGTGTPVAQDRLLWAAADLRAGLAPLIVVSGGNVHPQGTPHNEALEMKRFLVEAGIPAAQVAIEPCARHSHTNLRNAGRYLLTRGLRRALVVTSRDQAMYFGRPRSSTFDVRCLADLGYLVGDLQSLDDRRVGFVPSGRALEVGRDPQDP